MFSFVMLRELGRKCQLLLQIGEWKIGRTEKNAKWSNRKVSTDDSVSSVVESYPASTLQGAAGPLCLWISDTFTELNFKGRVKNLPPCP